MKSLSITILLISALISTCVAQQKKYILVHGAWHGSWCWKKVVPLLEGQGNKAIAIDLPGHGDDETPVVSVTLDDYVKKVVAEANKLEGQVILVGHSMAGVVIAQAGEVLGKEKISALVFLDAFMPLNGESVFALVEKANAANGSKQSGGPSLMTSLVFSKDKSTSTVRQAAIKELFYHDCSEADVAFAEQHVGQQPTSCLATPVQVTDAVYGAIPKYYILCTKARDLDKSAIASNVPSRKIYKLTSSHSPFFSMPEKLVNILVRL